MNNVIAAKVWYAVYGTNLNERRFSCYIRGGTPNGTSKFNTGCHDKTPFVDGGPISIPFQLYFAKSSRRWEDGSVGFLALQVDPTVQTLGRKYLITRDQFEDVFRQENDIGMSEIIVFDLVKARHEGSLTVRKSWYGKIIFLGIEAGLPVFTLTAHWDLDASEVRLPSSNYLQHIIKGIRQTYHISDQLILEYLTQKPGINAQIARNDLLNIIQQL
jgi:hypothetical protein